MLLVYHMCVVHQCETLTTTSMQKYMDADHIENVSHIASPEICQSADDT